MTTFNKILVALDGSPFSEQSLRLVDAIRAKGEPECLLFRSVFSEGEAAAPQVALDEAQEYLREIGASRLGGSAKVLVKQGEDPAEQVLEEAEGHDLVVVMTHGRGGPKRWILGSVAERIVRHCSVPVLLGNAKAREGWEIKKILVPLDGSEVASSVLELAGSLARGHEAEIVLFRAAWVDPTDNMLAYTRESDALRRSIKAELEQLAEPLRRDGIQVTPRVALDYPAEAILKAAQLTGSDLIAMTTHGRTGLKRWVLGSVAEKVLRASGCPVLLVRVPDQELS